MDNKLVFKPQTLTAYNWNRYNLIEDKTYKWDKYSTAPEYLNHYYWNKYSVIREHNFYIWDVYDSGNTYLGEIGSFSANQYPNNGTTDINGYTRKTVYKTVIDSGNNLHIWEEYNPIYTYNKVEVYQPYDYTFKVHQANEIPRRYYGATFDIGVKCDVENAPQGTTGVFTSVLDISPYDGTGHIVNTDNTVFPNWTDVSGVQFHPYLCNQQSRTFYLTKTKPIVRENPNWTSENPYYDGQLVPKYYLEIRNGLTLNLDEFTKEDFLDYLGQGYKYWVYEADDISTPTSFGRGAYFELVPNLSYFTNDRVNGIQLFNVVLRVTVADSVYGLIGDSAFDKGNLSNNGSYYILRNKVSTGLRSYFRTGVDFYNLTFEDEPETVRTTSRNYPVNEFKTAANYHDCKYCECISMIPVGERTYGDVIKTFNSSARLNEGILPNQDFAYVVSSIDRTSFTIGDFIRIQYTGSIPANYRDLAYIDNPNTSVSDGYMAPYFNQATNTYWIYKGLADNRYRHKWNRYRKNINTSNTISTYQWYHNVWDMSIADLQYEANMLSIALRDNQISENDILKREGNSVYIKCRNIRTDYPLLMGMFHYVKAKRINNEENRIYTLKVKYEYYCENSLPSFIIPSMTIDDYHYVVLHYDGNSVIGGETFLFCDDLFSETPYAYPGEFIDEVYSLDINAYPTNGVGAQHLVDYYTEWMIPEGTGDYYIYQGVVDNDGLKGDFIEEVETNVPNIYPTDGISNNYWYVYLPNRYYREVVNWIKQNKIGTVSSLNNRNTYPDNGFWPNNYNDGYTHYHYVYTGYTSAYSQGTYIERLKTYIRTSYPDNSFVVNDAWYIYAGETIETTAELTIDNTKLMGGVNYKQEINPSQDLQIGATAAAQVDFTIYAPDAAAATQYLGKDFEYYVKMNSDNDWRKIGIFVLTTAELPDKQTAKIQGFDYINKFDIVVDDWLFNLSFPLSLGDLFNSLCEYVGCEAYSTSFTNSDFMVNDNFEAVQITGRTILQYITEVSGGFCVAEPDGRIRIKHYSQPLTPVNLGSNSYKKYTYEVYNVPVITSVIVRKDDDDEGVESNV